MPDNIDQKSLVWYNAKNATDVAVWTKRIDKFLSGMNFNYFPMYMSYLI